MALTRDDFFWSSFSAHAEKSVKASALLTQLVEDPTRIGALHPAIVSIENEGDHIVHAVMHALHQTWITPLDREEIHELIKALDDFLDAIEEAAESFRVCGVQKSRDPALRMATVIAEIAERIAGAIKSLPNLKANEPVLKLLVEINERENEADRALGTALEQLFKNEPDAIELIKWRDLFRRLEEATDAGEQIAHVLEGIVLEHA